MFLHVPQTACLCSRFGQHLVELSGAMANLPRWIEDKTCDSAAMYSAFLACKSDATEEEKKDVKELYVVNHKAGSWRTPSTREVQKNCAETGCRRCAAGEGGYQLWWFDMRWYATYERLAREGAWKL